jgi:hypothetical protein
MELQASLSSLAPTMTPGIAALLRDCYASSVRPMAYSTHH